MAARQRTMPGTVHGTTTYDPARRPTDRSRGETAAALAARACEQTVTVNAENAHLLTLRVPKSPKQPKKHNNAHYGPVRTRSGRFDVTMTTHA